MNPFGSPAKLVLMWICPVACSRNLTYCPSFEGDKFKLLRGCRCLCHTASCFQTPYCGRISLKEQQTLQVVFAGLVACTG